MPETASETIANTAQIPAAMVTADLRRMAWVREGGAQLPVTEGVLVDVDTGVPEEGFLPHGLPPCVHL